MKETDINNQFDKLYTFIKSDSFLDNSVIRAEIPNYILSFDPHKICDYEIMVESLAKKLTTSSIRVLSLDLYDVMLDILNEDGDLNDVLQTNLSKKEMREDFSSILDIGLTVAPTVAKMIQKAEAQVVLLHDIGAAYPFIRVHVLLEKLPSLLEKLVPVVVFYPGDYDILSGCANLRLFNLLEPRNYYRAFDINKEIAR